MSASVGEDKKEPPEIKWPLIILSALVVIGIAALAVAFKVKLADFKKYDYLGAFLISPMAAATVIIYVLGVLLIFALGRILPTPFFVGLAAGKTIKRIVVALPGWRVELHSGYRALELLTSLGSRKIL
jgi:hypothetical protein